MTKSTTSAAASDGRTAANGPMEMENAMGATGQTTVDAVLGITMTRRRALRLLGAAGATAVLAGATQLSSASAAQQLRTLSALNLRAKPRSDARVLRVMPEGAVVTRIPGGAGRYVKVVYDGTRGYAHLDYLDDAIDQGDGGGEDQVIVGTGKTITDVNLRSGPSTSHSVLRVLDPNTALAVSGTVQNGFRYVTHNGLAGWVWDAYIGQGGGAGAVKRTTTSAVNHRATPSTSAAILAVIPAGATVASLEETSNDFEKVYYNGKEGWVYAAYLN